MKVKEKKNVTKSSEFKKILEAGNFMDIPQIGDIVKGKVINATRSEVRLDIDGLTTGVVRGQEFFDESDEYSNLKIGDEVEATVVELENENGEMELSFRFAGHQKAWDKLQQLRKEVKVISVEVIDANKGGLMVKLGQIIGFLPVSQLSPEHYPRVQDGNKNMILERLKGYIGKFFEVKIMDIQESESKLIVSEKMAWEEKKGTVISQYKVGDKVSGKITAVTDFGVFVEFGEKLEGLVHISELAWQRIDHPGDLVKVGNKVEAEIINIDGSKIFLSTKKLKQDPWKDVEKKYKVGQIVEGRVLKVNPFGLFVELDPDIHGLAHISEISDQPFVDPKSVAKVNDVLKFKILSVEPANHRLGLSLKGLKEEKNKPPKKEAGKTEPAA